jgi:peptidoglycan hydrolase-like protein with peptidoglycan-binding domain
MACRLRRGAPARVFLVLAVALTALPIGGGSAVAEAPTVAGPYTLGLFDPLSGAWYLRDGTGHTTQLDDFGGSGDIPLAGDWDGDGIDTPGLYRPEAGRLVIRNASSPIVFIFAMPGGGIPVVADTDGDGRDTVSLARGGNLHVMDGLGRGPAALEGPDPMPIPLPAGTEALVGGDFDGDGLDEVAAVHDGTVEVVGAGGGTTLGYIGGALPVAGDWDGDGIHTLGGYDSWRAEFRLYGPDGKPAPVAVEYGSTGMLPVAGDFGDLPGVDTPPPRRAGLPPLSEGDEGADVALLQQELARRHLFRGTVDGVFGKATAYAVVAFHKVLGVERTWEWEAEDSLRMANFVVPPIPDRLDEPDRIEVDVGRQVLYLIEGGELTRILPVSTAGNYVYWSERQQATVGAGTPHGDFKLIRHSLGWNCDPVTGWCIYNPWNFTDYYALHGYGSVPAYPASHGCVRIPTWEADLLEGHLYIGMPFHVWDEYRPATRR